MKLKSNILFSAVLCMAAALTSCKKNNDVTVSGKGKVYVEFENMVGENDLVLNNETYKNAHGDKFTITGFKYYVSNVSLVKADGSKYTVPNSYFFIDAAAEEDSFKTLDSIPAGDYTAITFTIGLDNEHNYKTGQKGALDPANGMFISQTDGYIFVQLKGTSPQSVSLNNELDFNIAGGKAPNNAVRTTTQTFHGDVLRVRSDSKPQIHLSANAAALFAGKTVIDFSTLSYVFGGAGATVLADNYADTFITVEHLHN